jgi:hypothetical protein
MPVKRVQFVKRHQIQNLLHFLLREKMAADIQHETAPGESRLVFNFDAGYLPSHVRNADHRKYFRRQQFCSSDCVP